MLKFLVYFFTVIQIGTSSGYICGGTWERTCYTHTKLSLHLTPSESYSFFIMGPLELPGFELLVLLDDSASLLFYCCVLQLHVFRYTYSMC